MLYSVYCVVITSPLFAMSFFFQKNQWTALMLATRQGNLRIVKALLDHGADPNAQNDVSCL